jgi:O-antigen/teichoic acid export membrane protein
MYLISEELIVLLFTQKWLPSVEYFKIFLLSGFAYPISALLVNILSSRGNSRAYLRLEIYKKILQSINLYVGFLWGINGYLYGLIVVAVFGVSLNILFAAREIKLPFLAFVKPIMTQMIISVIGVCLIIFLTKEIVTYAIALLLLKSILFTIFYFSVNLFMHTSSYEYFREQTVQVLKRRKRGEQV